MLNFVDRPSRLFLIILVLCTSFCLFVVYDILINRSECGYLCRLAIKSLSSTNYSALTLSILTTKDFLSTKHPELVSPNGRFILRLESTGNLRYLQSLHFQSMIDLKTDNTLLQSHTLEKSLFFTSTGDSWPGEHIVDLTTRGVLRVRVKATFMNDWKTTWTSALLPYCKKSSLNESMPILSVHNSGQLAIYSRRESSEPLCILHPEVIIQFNVSSRRIVTTSSKGKSPRLAIVIAGLFRSNTVTCLSHVEKIINKWQQNHGNSVDVFIFTYIQDARIPNNNVANSQTITAALQSCYKDNLKGFRVRNVQEVEERFPAIDPSQIQQCDSKLNRLQSQLKTVYLAGQIMRNYMLSEGITYDYVLRLRPDTDLWGNIPDLPIFGVFDDQTRIFLPHPYKEHYYWCSHHDGRVRTGVTDQLAYGTLPVMQTYLNMYLEFSEMVRIVTGHDTNNWNKAKYNTMACEGTVGESGCDRPNVDRCAIECLVSYYLVLHGLEPEILWTWQQNVLTAGGGHHKDCGKPFNCR